MSSGIVEPYREVAAAIVMGTCGRFLFQQRDDIPGLLYAGLLGLFGGHREDGETPMQCVQRELLEETGLDFESERFRLLVDFRALYPAGGGVVGTYYILDAVPLDKVVITEGSPFIAERKDLPALLARMTPSACYVTRLFLQLK